MNIIQKFSDFLIGKTLGMETVPESIAEPEKRTKVGYLEAWVSIIGNMILAVIKLLLGLMINSISLIADAIHTASDVLTSLVVIIGFKLSSMPADEEHPYGHGRIEFIATLIISLMLIGVGVKFGISSYERLVENTAVQGTYAIAVFMVLAGVLKEIMSQLSIQMGNKINSSTLIADAWHHRTDAVASILVAVAILASYYGYYRVDAILGFAVSGLIIYTGIDIFKDSCSKLIGETDNEQVENINEIALKVPGVLSTHDICVHDYGMHKIISIHIEVNENLTVVKAHDIAEQVEEKVNFQMYAQTTVHVDSRKSNS